MTFSKRMAARREAEGRARGENVDYLTRDVPREFRTKLWFALLDLGGGAVNFLGHPIHLLLLRALHARLLREYGVGRLGSKRGQIAPEEDLNVWILQDAPAEKLMDIVEYAEQFVGFLINNGVGAGQAYGRYEAFRQTVSQALDEHKLAWGLLDDGKIVERDSAVMHAEVVAPALNLLHGRARFKLADQQFRDALDELAKDKWADAITDANAAVEIVLREITGLQQGQLPALLDEARRQKIFGDEEDRRLRKFVDGFKALADMRNQEGDAHGNTSTRESAWLAVHWAGALIVFIVERAESLGL